MALANTRGVTRWRRSAVIAVPATAAVAGMAAAMLNGVLAANVSLSNVPFTLQANQVQTDDRGLGLNAQSIVTAGNTTGTAAAVAGINQARLNTVCASASIASLGKFLNISIPATQTTANNLVLDASSLAASDGTIGGSSAAPVVLGQSSSAVGHGVNTAATTTAFGLVTGDEASTNAGLYGGATGTTLNNLNASALGATIGGSLTVATGTGGLKISIGNTQGTPGASTC